MIKTTVSIPGPGGPLSGRLYAPDQRSRAVVSLIHGLGEHASRYEHVARFFTDAGIGLVTCDLPGHGASPGRRGALPPYEQLLQIPAALVQVAKEKFSAIPVFLMGHSYGGGIAANFALQRPESLAGLILSSPWLRLTLKPKAIDLFLARILAPVLPNITLKSGLDANGISRIPEEVARYRADKQVHDRISPLTFRDAVAQGENAIEAASRLTIPLFAAHGTADPITDPAATQSFFARVTSGATPYWVEGGYHELHNDLDAQKLLTAYAEWIQAHS